MMAHSIGIPSGQGDGERLSPANPTLPPGPGNRIDDVSEQQDETERCECLEPSARYGAADHGYLVAEQRDEAQALDAGEVIAGIYREIDDEDERTREDDAPHEPSRAAFEIEVNEEHLRDQRRKERKMIPARPCAVFRRRESVHQAKLGIGRDHRRGTENAEHQTGALSPVQQPHQPAQDGKHQRRGGTDGPKDHDLVHGEMTAAPVGSDSWYGFLLMSEEDRMVVNIQIDVNLRAVPPAPYRAESARLLASTRNRMLGPS